MNKQWIVTGTSMVTEAESAEEAIARAEQSSGWHWEATPVVPDPPAESADPPRPTTGCGCGFELVWVEGQWQHDAAPSLWGDDHDADEPEPTGFAREFWDYSDGIRNELPWPEEKA